MDLVHDRGSIDPVHESGPWTRSKVGVHGPLVHVLSSPLATVSITMSFRTLLSDQGRRQKANGSGRRKEGEKLLDPRPQIFPKL